MGGSEKPRVLLVGNYPEDRQYSMLAFARALETGLATTGLEVVKATPTRVFGKGFGQGQARKWFAYADKYLLFPRELKRMSRASGIVHILDQGNSLYVRHIRNRPHLVTCHDLLAVRAARNEIPGWKTGLTGQALQGLILKGLASSQYVVCDSIATRGDLVRLLPAAEGKSKVIPLAPLRSRMKVPEPQVSEVLARFGIAKPFILHIGGNQPYKNRIGAIRIFRELRMILQRDMSLVIAGPELPSDLRLLLDKSTIEVARPSDDEIDCLYAAAEALIFPSLFEGFGLPILEAQSHGCPVFTTGRPPMTEVGGSGARYFQPEEELEAAAKIAQHWPDRAKMKADGFKNVARFDPALLVQRYSELYAELGGFK